MSSEYDYHIASEPDVSGKINRHIWFIFIMLGLLLLFLLSSLTITYRFFVGYQEQEKIGDIRTKESLDQEALSESYLSGKRGLFEDKRHVAIDVAINQFIADVRKAK